VFCRTPFWFTFIINQIQPYNLQGAKRVNLMLQRLYTSARALVCMCATRTSTHRHGVGVCWWAHECVTHTWMLCVRARKCHTHIHTGRGVCGRKLVSHTQRVWCVCVGARRTLVSLTHTGRKGGGGVVVCARSHVTHTCTQ